MFTAPGRGLIRCRLPVMAALLLMPVAASQAQFLVVDTLVPQSNVIVANTGANGSVTMDAGGSGVGQSFLMPDAGPFAYRWNITTLTVQKDTRQTIVNFPLTLWVFQWVPSDDAGAEASWIAGHGQDDPFTDTGIDTFHIDGRQVRLTGTIAEGKYLHFNFGEAPLTMDDNTAYGFYLEGGGLAFDINASRAGAYDDGLSLFTDSHSNSTNRNKDLTFWVQGTAITGPEQPGDYNEDGKVDQDDLTLVLGNWGGVADSPQWTAPYDGVVDQSELTDLLANWGAGIEPPPPPPVFNPGDFNEDSQVDQDDLNLVLQAWGDLTMPDGWQATFDGLMDQNELNALLENWGDGIYGSTTLSTAVVPEPATFALLAVAGLIGLGRRRRVNPRPVPRRGLPGRSTRSPS